MVLKSSIRRALGAGLIIGVLQMGSVHAAVASATAATVDPAEPAEQYPDVGTAVDTAAPSAEDTGVDAAAPAEEDTRRIDVWEYRIDGNTVLGAADIEAAVQPFLGPQRSVQDIEQARASLEQAYRGKGFETVGVEIPEQDVRIGVVRFNIVELQVGRLRVTGSRFYSPDRIKDAVPSLAEGMVPRYDLVSQDIQAVNNARDRTITPTLRAGIAPGTVDVDLEVEDRMPLHATFELNDRYTNQTSRLRAVASVSYANLFQRDHSLSLQVQAVPENFDESFLISASYLAPIPGTPASVVVYGMRSDSDVAAVGGIDVIGKGDVFGIRGVLPLPGSSARFSHSLLAGFDYKNFREDLVLGADTAATPIDYLPLTLEYSMTALGWGGSTDLRTSLNWGTRGLGSTNEEFAFKRYGARANFFYVRADLTRTQTLPADMRLITSLSGQLSDQPLISNEGFSVGGLDSVRGYAESQALGDSGLRASLQLESPSFGPRLSPAINEWRAFAFGDWGQVRIKDALADINGAVTDEITLASVGLGTRLRMFDKYNALLLLAAPLKNKEDVDFDLNDEFRAQFRIWAEF